MITRDDESKATMKKGNTVTVTYHNVMVGADIVSFDVRATDTVTVPGETPDINNRRHCS